MTSFVLIAVSLAFAVARIAGVIHPSFQAFAHLWVGGLFAASWYLWRTRNLIVPVFNLLPYRSVSWPTALTLAVGLSLIELGCFVWDHFLAVP